MCSSTSKTSARAHQVACITPSWLFLPWDCSGTFGSVFLPTPSPPLPLLGSEQTLVEIHTAVSRVTIKGTSGSVCFLFCLQPCFFPGLWGSGSGMGQALFAWRVCWNKLAIRKDVRISLLSSGRENCNVWRVNSVHAGVCPSPASSAVLWNSAAATPWLSAGLVIQKTSFPHPPCHSHPSIL